MAEIHPTHTCFDDALDHIEKLLMVRKLPPTLVARDYRLVHGLYRCQTADSDHPRTIAHAYVLEKPKGLVWQDGYQDGERITYGITRAEFHSLMKPLHETSYSMLQAYKMNIKHNNYGPWLPLYLKHCRSVAC